MQTFLRDFTSFSFLVVVRSGRTTVNGCFTVTCSSSSPTAWRLTCPTEETTCPFGWTSGVHSTADFISGLSIRTKTCCIPRGHPGHQCRGLCHYCVTWTYGGLGSRTRRIGPRTTTCYFSPTFLVIMTISSERSSQPIP